MPETEPVLLMTPRPASDTPFPLEEETLPAFVIVQVVPVPPSMPSTPEPVEVTLPVLVMVRGLSAVLRTTGPVVLVLIVFDIGPPFRLPPYAVEGFSPSGRHAPQVQNGRPHAEVSYERLLPAPAGAPA